jgi:hypothetical protein
MFKKLKTLGADAILTAMIIPFIAWFISFIVDTKQAIASIGSTKEDIQEIKDDVKFIRQYLMEKK